LTEKIIMIHVLSETEAGHLRENPQTPQQQEHLKQSPNAAIG
jgi:hypothetical protein